LEKILRIIGKVLICTLVKYQKWYNEEISNGRVFDAARKVEQIHTKFL